MYGGHTTKPKYWYGEAVSDTTVEFSVPSSLDFSILAVLASHQYIQSPIYNIKSKFTLFIV